MSKIGRNDTELIIRQAKNQDFEEIYAIWLEGITVTFADTPKPGDLKQQFLLNFNSRNEYFNFWVGVKDVAIIGWISVLPMTINPLKRNSYGELSIYLDKKNNYSGLSNKLVVSVISELSQSPLQFVLAYVLETNIQANKFFTKYFTIVGRLPSPIKEPFYSAKNIYTLTL